MGKGGEQIPGHYHRRRLASVVTLSLKNNKDSPYGWGAMEAERPYKDAGASSPMSSQGPPSFGQLRREPECKEIDSLVKTMRSILHNRFYVDGARLEPLDDETVQELLPLHPDYAEKLGCGVDHIKIDIHPDYPETRCFWIVRTDGSELDFSYHKCLKEKVAKDFPWFVDRYDALYKRKPRGPG